MSAVRPGGQRVLAVIVSLVVFIFAWSTAWDWYFESTILPTGFQLADDGKSLVLTGLSWSSIGSALPLAAIAAAIAAIVALALCRVFDWRRGTAVFAVTAGFVAAFLVHELSSAYTLLFELQPGDEFLAFEPVIQVGQALMTLLPALVGAVTVAVAAKDAPVVDSGSA